MEKRKTNRLIRKLALIAALPLAFLCTGCEHSCVTFISNPGGGFGGSGFTSPCPTAIPQGTVKAVAHVAHSCESCAQSNQVESAFVSLRGIQLHPQSKAVEVIAEWREIHAELAIQPRQFELMKVGNNRLTAIPLGDSAPVSAGAYDGVRLRFATGLMETLDSPAGQNACGNVGVNCVVMGDGRILPLVLPGDVLELPISSGTTSDIFLVLPDGENQLWIELTLAWTLASPPGQSSQLLPVLTGTARRSSKD